MSENIEIKTRQKWFGTYHKLAELAQKANIRVVLELLSALRHSKDDLEARDRLNQALTHVLVSGSGASRKDWKTRVLSI